MTTQTAPLSKVQLSPLNARKRPSSKVEAMAVSIEHDGLLQNLVCYEEAGTFYVCAGGTRWQALKLLQKKKVIKANYEVRIEVRPKEDAIHLSMQENIQREDMHKADKVRGFAALRDAGMTVEQIAARYSQPASMVYKFLRLGSLAPSLLEAFGNDEMALEAAQALTLTEDHETQEAVFKRCGNRPQQIRAALTSEKMTTKSNLFRFVGRDVYEAAGGTVTADLFDMDGNGYADQPELVEELAEKKLNEAAAKLNAEGWHKVEVTTGRPDNAYMLPSIYPETRPFTEAEQAERDQLEAQIVETEDESDDDANLAAYNRIDEIDAAAREFTAEQKASGGVKAFVSYHSGELEFIYYRAVTVGAGAGKAPPPAFLGGYTALHYEEMSKIKTQAVQEAVASDPVLALDILLDTLTGQLLHHEHSFQMPLSLRAERPNVEVADELMGQSQIQLAADTVADEFGHIPAQGRFATIRAMAENEKMSLLAGLVGVMLDGSVAKGMSPSTRNEVMENYARAADLDVSAKWAPPLAFFDRMKRTVMLDVMADECGEAAKQSCATLKKKDLAVALAERLPPKWLPDALKVSALAENADLDVADLADDESEMVEAA